MVSQAIIHGFHTGFGIIGNICSFFMFLAPIVTLLKIYKKGAAEGFSHNPWVVTFFNCALWVYYGMLHSGNVLVITINGTGLVMEFIYVVMYVFYANKKQRWHVFFKVVAGLVFLASVVLSFTFVPGSESWRGKVIGYLCVAVNIAMYAMPCDTIRQVYQNKSVEYMQFPLLVCGLLNGASWSTYGLLEFDKFIVICNGTGVVLSIIQIGVYQYYNHKYPQPEDEIWSYIKAFFTSKKAEKAAAAAAGDGKDGQGQELSDIKIDS